MFFGHVNSKNVNSGDFWIFMMLLNTEKVKCSKKYASQTCECVWNKAHKQSTLVAKFTLLSLIKSTVSNEKYASPLWSYHDTPDTLHPSQQLALHSFHKSVRAHTAPMRTPHAVQSDTPRRIVTLSRPTLTTLLILIAAYCCFATPSMSTPAMSTPAFLTVPQCPLSRF